MKPYTGDLVKDLLNVDDEMQQLEERLISAGYTKMPGPEMLMLSAKDFIGSFGDTPEIMEKWVTLCAGAFIMAKDLIEAETKGVKK